MDANNKNYNEWIELAILKLKDKNFEGTKEALNQAFILDDLGTEVQNILGVYYELKGMTHKALCHYRAAYALEPSNPYADHNIERLVMGPAVSTDSNIYYGNEKLEEPIIKRTTQARREIQCTQ